MRRRILHVAVVAVSVALVLFGIPLGVAARATILSEERGELERTALLASRQVGPDFLAGDPVELPRVEGDKQVAVYDASLTHRSPVTGGPPAADSVTRAAARGVESDGVVGAQLVVAVPVTVAEKVIAVVRVAAPTNQTWTATLLAWAALVLSAGLALVVAVLVARRQARFISTPLEALAVSAERVAAGDLQTRAQPAGTPELVRLAQSQNEMLDRLCDLIARERQLTAEVSHQLRTPVTGLALGLQNALSHEGGGATADPHAALVDALGQVRDLERTIDNVIQLARPEAGVMRGGPVRSVGDFCAEVERRWRGTLSEAGRPLVVTAQTDLALCLPQFVVTEVLKILMDNATRHGAGRVTVVFRDLGSFVAIDVTDEGSVQAHREELFRRGQSGSDGLGIGLALGRSIAEAYGGRLALTLEQPTRFTLMVPLPSTPSEPDPTLSSDSPQRPVPAADNREPERKR
ncbi:HAMP domain-containing sensor histidine kinase [Terrabacter aerolatus]|uniref:histidine kinase n=1 Tax=Terrabacter aerolatus TaxID=422442 RepID=A0A512D7E8_9MICO|nr:HAMP domain-containing sensor histidine kinase [Terrabacter aerolatus]GEO32170.1 two-component sensor histidine kinase [Terrabacter aerolatus]